jgi:hypothetical protein
VERTECAPAIGRRELIPAVKQEVIGRPMTGKRRDRGVLVGAIPDGLSAIAAVFRGKNQFFLGQIEVAIGSAIVGTALQLHQFLRWLIGAVCECVEVRPVLAQLVATVHGRKHSPCGIEYDAFAVAQAGNVALGTVLFAS